MESSLVLRLCLSIVPYSIKKGKVARDGTAENELQLEI